ncbi:hypothetical protein LUW74_16930 [Actinomadura madurae]|uniref:four-carbon acid sugar kinase family protein n=1 Tax=Actinomadura madurae TaxID=1993 RepID=UPI002026C4B9|nr:four-carbon acid sugar kinase family protein [Actinomadura madurae]URN04839.1 hypothetical protein LUW74_16930 [Actinomadura madurae]
MERSDRPAPVLARELFASLPPPRRVPGALDLIRAHNREDGVRLVVFDDDPTGDQTVHGVPILTLAAPMDEIAGAVLEEDHPAVFVLTNSRSMDPGDAAETAARLAGTLYERARRNGAELRVISRSDSTLRGHFPTETDALAKAAASAGIPYDGVLLCPAFLEAGRCTVGDVQWVRSGETLRPSCDTEYARDAAFGYSEATLPEWAAARTGRDRSEIVVVSLADLRVGGVARVADRLRAVDGRIVVANAADPADLEVLCLALREAERAGTRLLYRTGPSFVRVRAGLPTRPPLTFADLFPATASPGPGLVVAGSHTELTSRQIAAARARHRLAYVELDVREVLAGGDRAAGETARCAADLRDALARRDGFLATSRTSTHADSPSASLADSRRISHAVAGVVAAALDALGGRPPRFLVAKGGITSLDVATEAFGVRRATVLGQLDEGRLSVWRPAGGRSPGMPYVVFPGNVGTEHTLADVLHTLAPTEKRTR